MRVKELIKELLEEDQEAEVIIARWEDSGCSCGFEIKETVDDVYSYGNGTVRLAT